MATLKEFEDALRQHGMANALAILDQLKKRDRERRSVAPARRVVGRKMTTELARTVIEMHATTGMTQQEIAFKLGVNQGRVNEVIKRGKWLNGDPSAPEARSRDKAIDRLKQRARERRATPRPGPLAPSTMPMTPAVEPPPAPAAAPRVVQPVSAVATVLASRSGELPLDKPDAVVLKAPERAPPKAEGRRGIEEASPIVSAQLAFLDL